MMKIQRLPAPHFLKERYKNWGRRYKARRDKSANAVFFWNIFNGQRINHLLLPVLMQMTQDHCSFCDGFPIETVSSDSIEHFKPKTKFPKLAYAWLNLFYCCSKCQESKMEDFDKTLLKPDILGYSFEFYFQYDSETGKIIPNPDRNEIEILRAEKTIELYGLNSHARPKARKRTIKQFIDSQNPVIEDFPYRFILTYLE